MYLTRHSDYSLRVLMFLAVKGDELATVPQITKAYGISRGHTMKIVQNLGHLGYVKTLRGRGGGITLGADPATIRLGEVVRQTEESLDLVECFSSRGSGCRIQAACRLQGAIREALEAFLKVLDSYTLADMVSGRAAPLRRLLQLA
jgi:Rrf2 family transcriptional regulator, nitric oxide-sensitive transcriptional repressor